MSYQTFSHEGKKITNEKINFSEQYAVFSRQSKNEFKKASVYQRFLFIAILMLGGFQVSFAQFKIPEKPTKTSEQTSVYDYYNLLTPTEKSNLEQKLIKYSDTTSTQIVVAIIASTQGENINYLGAQWGQKWGIGQAKGR